MKTYIPSFEEFLNESYKFQNIEFIPSSRNKSTRDTLLANIDSNTRISYSIWVTPGKYLGKEFMEISTGPKYVKNSTGRSSYKSYEFDEIPAKYQNQFNELRNIYQTEYRGKSNSNYLEDIGYVKKKN